MPWLLALLVAASLWGGWNWWHHERRVAHPPGVVVDEGPAIRLGETSAPWRDDQGFHYTALGVFEGRAMVLARRNYDVGEFAALAPTDLALGWGPMSDPAIVGDLAFAQMKSFSSRFVVPELRSGAAIARLPRAEIEDMLRSLTHVHAIPADAAIAKSLAGIRPGQVIRFRATLVDATAPSGGRYTSSAKLGDRDCEIAWIHELELE